LFKNGTTFYYYEAGKNITATLSQTVLLVFALFPKFAAIFFNPENPWDRYDGLSGI
jgi:hypothetical protein